MKITFLKTISTTRRCYTRGKGYEVEPAEAAEYVTKGLAVEVSPDPVTPVEPAAPAAPKARKKKPKAGE